MQARIFAIALVMVFLVCQFVYAETTGEPEPYIHANLDEIQALNQLSEQMSGYITWMSNRDGDWEVYRMDIDGGNIQQLTRNKVPDRGALISYDGKLIAWHRGDDRKRNVWVMNADGSEQRMLVTNAAMGIWRSDGKLIVYRGKDNDSTFLYDPATENEKQIWPPKNVKFKAKDIWGAKPSPDGKLFVGWSPRPRGTWLFSSDGKFQKHVHGGCENLFSPDGSFLYWVKDAGDFGKATLKGEMQDSLYKPDETYYGHTYFPILSKDMKYLIFGACPNDQHNHDTSDYEIFLMKMVNLKPAWETPIRLTYDPGTDRWADIFVPVDDTPPHPPLYVDAEPHGQQVRLTWTDAQDAETSIKWYKIYRGTEKNGEQLLAKVRDTVYVDRWTDADVDYHYKVSAINAAGLEGVRSRQTSARTSNSIPMTPANVYINPAGSGKGRLTWTANPELDVTGYNVYRSVDGDGIYAKLNPEVIPKPLYIDSSVENGVIYYYQVSAVDESANESRRSTPVLYTPEEHTMPDGLLVFYPFDEGSGDIVHDRSGVVPLLDLTIKDMDKVTWIGDANGVEFTGSSMIVSNGNANKLFEKLKSGKQLSIEVWLTPGNLSQNGPARIVSMSKDSGQRNFTVGQAGREISVRLRTTETGINGTPELSTTESVLSIMTNHIVTIYDGAVKRLYINGLLHSESQELTGDFSTWADYPLVIGNELQDDRTWLGRVYMVAIYDRSLSVDEIRKNYQYGIQ